MTLGSVKLESLGLRRRGFFLMQPRNQTARQRFAQFLRDIDYGRSAGDLQFAYAIVPLPIVVDYGPLAAVDTADSDGRGRFIADTLAATLSEAHE